MTKDFLFITLDSLRWDVTQLAMANDETPNLQELIGQWEQREAAGTYTLPSHVSMFGGMMPRPPLQDAYVEHRLFGLSTRWERNKGRDIRWWFEDAPNVPKGFESLGYRCVGIGGVGWFSNKFASSQLWQREYFRHFLWDETYGAGHPNGFGTQIADLAAWLIPPSTGRLPGPHFVFINVATTHAPYKHGTGGEGDRQAACLRYIDGQLPALLGLFSNGVEGVICSDHGDCMGEEGLHGHGFLHEKVMTIPYAEF